MTDPRDTADPGGCYLLIGFILAAICFILAALVAVALAAVYRGGGG